MENASQKLWSALIEADNYLAFGIKQQLSSNLPSFGGEDMKPLMDLVKTLRETRPYISAELADATDIALKSVEHNINLFLDMLREYNASKGQHQKDVEARALYQLNITTLQEYRSALKRVESLLPLPERSPNMDTISILFVSADPTNASRLRLGEEFREIQEKLKLARQRDRFKLELPQLSVRPADISQALLDVQPQIVHFSGHGMSTGELSFENQIGQIHPVEPAALAALFEQFANQVSCVIFNACYSEIQARAIVKYIEYVIGMNQAIGDKAAIAFAVGFYQALGAGRTMEEAYRLGCVQIRLQGIPEHLTPVLIKKEQVQS